MKNSSKKSILVKSGIAVAVIGLVATISSQLNHEAYSVKFSDAQADYGQCTSAKDSTCSFSTGDGLPHTVTNAYPNQ